MTENMERNETSVKKTEKCGKVWLAGAGPGDLGLLTLKTAALIEEADVIVYDALISAEILSRIPEGKETINVGKHSGHHPVPQHEINAILVREAEKGKNVLRLKGGDPFIFGRGGEEAETLIENNIPFEVVPGVTSAAAVPAYAGIPVTHRDFTSSFHVITGHAKKDGSLHIDFESLVHLNGTLVFLMGVASMPAILEGLIKAGMDPDMPAAVLEKGTSSAQRRVIGTVSDLVEKARKAGVGTPAIIVVGKVCALADTMHWAEDRTLGGRQFLITRPRKNSSVLAGKLRRLGAQVVELPAIRTEMITPNEKLGEALSSFGKDVQEEWLVFTSPAGVEVFFAQLLERKTDLRTLFSGNACGENGNGKQFSAKIAAIGSATAGELEKHGLIPDLVPGVYSASELGKELAGCAGENSRITILRAEKGSKELIPPLLEAGLSVQDIPIYRTFCETGTFLKEKIAGMFYGGEIDAVTFTSGSTVRGFAETFAEIAGRAEDGLDLTRIEAVCIGEQTAREAEKYGMKIHVAREASMDAMVEKITELYGR